MFVYLWSITIQGFCGEVAIALAKSLDFQWRKNMIEIPRCKTHNRKMRMVEFQHIGLRPLCEECTLVENWERVRKGGE